MSNSGLVILVLAVVLGFYLAAIYNRLVTLKNRYQNAFAQIENQLKRRYDLIPNLVETAKAYLNHERETLESVVSARNSAAQALTNAQQNPGASGQMSSLSGAENNLAEALGRFNLVVEAYPELKANDTMAQLSEELSSTENKVAFARQAFNDAVTEYNAYRERFPQILVAASLGHSASAELLEFADSAAIQQPPKVSF